MSTITSSLTSSAGAYPQLGQSLINLTASSQPAALGSPESPAMAEDAGQSDIFAPLAAAQETALQNQLSALADSDAASAANQAAANLLSTQSSTLAAQANLAPASVLTLLQD
ncbi:MAG TPA: hypothetical protein VHV47_11925 [Opitutaceae bacterium]|jgi:hypothetical protein|nr:hypothetical protein [Opitutaceae bacterium]